MVCTRLDVESAVSRTDRRPCGYDQFSTGPEDNEGSIRLSYFVRRTMCMLTPSITNFHHAKTHRMVSLSSTELEE